MDNSQTWMDAPGFRQRFSAFRRELWRWTMLYLLLAFCWVVTVVVIWPRLSNTPAGRLVLLLLAAGTLLPLVLGAFHTRRLQVRHGMYCPFCRRGLGGSDGKMALLTGNCPSCEKEIISIES
jgi:hypothetical protein